MSSLDNEITLYPYEKIQLPLFDRNYMVEIVNKVIELSKKNKYFINLSRNYSYEGGFNLPLDENWINAIKQQNNSKFSILQYHSNREFRFTMADSSIVNGLRTKDGLKYWTIIEVENIKKLIKQAIDFFAYEIKPIILSENDEINFNEFDINLKMKVSRKVIELSKDTILDGINISFSHEGGFTLPLSILMRDAIRAQNQENSNYLKYHYVRDFRYIDNNEKISGLRTKDSLRWWTNEEINEFIKLINLSIASI